jgi:hypothetical protein
MAKVYFVCLSISRITVFRLALLNWRDTLFGGATGCWAIAAALANTRITTNIKSGTHPNLVLE